MDRGVEEGPRAHGADHGRPGVTEGPGDGAPLSRAEGPRGVQPEDRRAAGRAGQGRGRANHARRAHRRGSRHRCRHRTSKDCRRRTCTSWRRCSSG
ncbi:MAG: hypothetical protein WC483_03890 [Candidatus Paceibacterota bacterium]